MAGKNSTDLEFASPGRPSAAREVIDLFEQHADVLRFPDVDADSLRALGDEVSEASLEVAKAEAALRAAREEQQRREQELLLQAKRAVAYARVFAEADPELMEQLSALTLARPAADKTSRTTRRKRTSKPAPDSDGAAALPFPAEA